MAKTIALTVALLVSLAAFSAATTFTTITTTTTIEEANPGQQQQQQCQSQVQRQRFESCQRYFQSQIQGRRMGGGEEDILLVMATEFNPRQQGQGQQYLQQCCNELHQVEDQCRCEAIKHAVRQSQQLQPGGSWQGEQSQQVYRVARELPRECGFRQQECQIRAIFV